MADAAAGAGGEEEEPRFPPFTIGGIASTKMMRIKNFDRSAVGPGHMSNNTKEDLCLEYVENFRKQFMDLFPARRVPYLTAKNECGIEKFVSTTLRPTQMPFKDMYALKPCAEFFAHFLKYEPLDNPLEYPVYLPSPATTLKDQIGDSFDFAFVLCSFLMGNGYDAYVVFGTAPRFITLRDQTATECNFDPEEKFATMLTRAGQVDGEEEKKGGDGRGRSRDGGGDDGEGAAGAGAAASRYKAGSKGVPDSEFQAMLEKRALEVEEARKPKLPELGEEETAETDPLEGRRVHAWVLVRGGKRDVDSHVFVEPSTGRVYPVEDSPYEVLESICNSRNYWVNMQDPAKGVGAISFDLDNSDDWEFVFIETGRRPDAAAAAAAAGGEEAKGTEGGDGMGGMAGMEGMAGLEGLGGDSGGGGGGGGGGDGAGGAAGGDGDAGGEPPTIEEDSEHVLDIPPPWVPPLVVDRDSYIMRYGPSGAATVLYRRAKLDRYAHGCHPQGLVTRLTRFRDLMRTMITEVVELYEQRTDRLLRRIRRPAQQYVEEYFDSGRPSGLKRHVEVLGKHRELEFYVSARLDGLRLRVEDIGQKVTEDFQGRDDKLAYRSVTLLQGASAADDPFAGRGAAKGAKMTHFTLQGEAGDMIIRKMTEKFDRNEAVDADKDVRKRTYLIQEKQIKEIYHYAPGRITSSSRTYLKEGASGTVELTSVNPFAQTPKMSELDEDFRNVIALEKECNHSVREAQREAQDILKKRRREEKSVGIDKTIFETAREKSKEDATKEAKDDAEETPEDSKVDYLTPFLQNCADPKHPTEKEAAKADRDCRKALKERLIERVNIIQRRLEEENSALQKRQAAFQRNRDHVQGADEEFEQFCAEAMFRIGILEQRLQRQEETVLAKFTELEAMLKNDPRLAIIYSATEDAAPTHGRHGRK